VLKYSQSGEVDAEGRPLVKRPVIIHRAILGSVERFVSVLTEQCAGKWPFWLSPRQAIVVPISPNFNDYASSVQQRLHSEGYFVDADLSSKSFNKKVREGQLAQYNFILVIGEGEQNSDSVNVRTRDNQVHGMKKISDLLNEWKEMTIKHSADF
jgi:threonyl-tRNA synthetase